MRQLRFAEPHVLRSSFARPNLSYAVRHDEDKNEQLLRVVRNVAGSGIVYVRTRDGCEQLTEFLRDAGVAATCYHVTLPSPSFLKERRASSSKASPPKLGDTLTKSDLP